jgi:hypothetical protein
MFNREKRILAALVLAGVAVACASEARASVITANAVIDLNSAITGNSWTAVASH